MRGRDDDELIHEAEVDEDDVWEALLVGVDRMSRDIRRAALTLGDTEVRHLVDSYYTIQEDRKRSKAQSRALTESGEPHAVINWLALQSETLEKQIRGALDVYTQGHVMGSYMRNIVGIGPVISAGLLAHIYMGIWCTICHGHNPEQCKRRQEDRKLKLPAHEWTPGESSPTVGHLWAFAGWAADGQKPWQKGERRPFNDKFRVLCCHPETMITTARGAVPIREIKIGDKVLTHRGRYRRVTQIHCNQHTGGLVGLRTFGNSALPLYVTDNHPVYTETRLQWAHQKGGGRVSFGARDRRLRAGALPDEQIRVMREQRRGGMKLQELADLYGCTIAAVSLICNEKTRRKPLENERMWVRADGVLPGWLLCSPKLPHGRAQTVATPKLIPAHRGGIARPLPNSIVIDEEMARFLGLFMAEGHVSGNHVGFSFHQAEIAYHQFVRDILSRRFGLDRVGYSANPETNGCQLIISSKALAVFLADLVGHGAFTKRVPAAVINGPAGVKAAFLRGWYEGDGDLASGMLTTSSAPHEAHALLNSLGIPASITPYQRSYKIAANPGAIAELLFDEPGEPGRRAFVKHEAEALWVQARQSETLAYSGPVFNLEVEEDHSYTANGIAVHNCWKAGQSFMKLSNHPNCFYGRIYRERKEYETAKNEKGDYIAQAATRATQVGKDTQAYGHYITGKLPPGHIDARARRYAVKLFLAHLHGEWYEKAFGKPAPLPYPIAHLGHAHMIHPPTIRGEHRSRSAAE